MSEHGPAQVVAGLIGGSDRGYLATLMRPDQNHAPAGSPYASLVLVAFDDSPAALLLISDLAEHSRNISADARVSLLLDGTAGLADPLTGARVTLMGAAMPMADPTLMARYVERHPSARMYAGFKDFRLYRMPIARAHLVAGFGRIHWIDGRDLTRL